MSKKNGPLNARQVASYKQLADVYRRSLRTVWLWWAIPLAFLLVGFWFHWHWYVRLFGWIGVITGIISHAEEIRRYREYQGYVDKKYRGPNDSAE